MAKRLDSRYEPGRRTGAWLKIKHVRRQELVICGWLPGEGRRTDRIGALLMGYWADDGACSYAGRVGTGFTERTLDELAAQAGAAAPRRQPVRRRAQAPAQRRVRRARPGGGDRVSRVDHGGGHARAVVQGAARRQGGGRGGARGRRALRPTSRATRTPRDGADAAWTGGSGLPRGPVRAVERLPEGALAVLADGRRAEDHQLGQGAVPGRRGSPRATSSPTTRGSRRRWCPTCATAR